MSNNEYTVKLKDCGDFLDNVDGSVLPGSPAEYLAAFQQARDIVQNHRTPAVLAVLGRPCGALDDINLDFLDEAAGMPCPRRRDPDTGRLTGLNLEPWLAAGACQLLPFPS